MHLIGLLCLSALVVLVSGGCDAITNAAKIKIPIEVKVYPKSDNPNIPMVDADCADLSTNKDYIDNKDQFEGATVKDVSAIITDLVDPVFASGTANDQVFTNITVHLTFDPSYGDPTVYEIANLTNVSLPGVLAPMGGTPLMLPKSPGADAAIAKILQRPKFCVSVNYGPMNTGPATAKFIQATIVLTVNFEASAI